MTSIALTIAGSDSCCGAGIQADIKTISLLGAYGVCAITALTAQNSTGVHDVFEVSSRFVGSQIDALANDFDIKAVKSGMLYSAEVVDVVAERVKHYGFKNYVIDPVIASKNGNRLLSDDAIKIVINKLIKTAFLITPNIPEAEILSGRKIYNPGDIKSAAGAINKLGVKNVLIKGGHSCRSSSSQTGRKAVDVLFDGRSFEYFEDDFIMKKSVHGTGCTYSAAITAGLAKGETLVEAISKAKVFISNAIKSSKSLGHGNDLIN